MSFTNGTTVGHYRIIDQLGQGGMATVYRAYDANLDRYVAIKVLHQAFKEDPNFLARFKREAQIVARLRHPHIVAVHGFDEHDGQPYLVMEFIAGETLKGRLNRQRLTLQETARLMLDIGDALTYAHEQGVLHRDIKPSNILVDAQGIPYLTDFGLARMVEAGESTLSQDMLLGTPQYISPEQAQGIKNLSPATDIYSLGIVLYQLVVGRVPFNADTPYAIVHDHIYRPLPIPSQINPDVPTEIEHVLLKALAKDPADRYPTASALVRDFQAAVEATGSQAYTPSRVVNISVLPSPTATPIPSQVIPAAAPPITTTGISSSAAIRRARQRRQLWMLGGLGTFMFTCLVGLFVGIVAVSNPELRPPPLVNGSPGEPGAGPPPTQESRIPTGITVVEARQLVNTQPDDPLAHFALGLALLENGERLLAQAALNRGVELAEDAPTQIADAARLADEIGYSAEAAGLYAAALSYDSDNADLRNEAGAYLYHVAVEANRLSLATLRRIANSHPDIAVLQAALARALIAMQEMDEAGQTLENTLSLDSTLPEAHLVQGEWYAASERLSDARREWRAAMSADDAPAWVVERADRLLHP